jgi:hypothetical protein
VVNAGDAVPEPDAEGDETLVGLLPAVEFPSGNGADTEPAADAEVSVAEPAVLVEDGKLVGPLGKVEFGNGNGADVAVVPPNDDVGTGKPVLKLKGVDCPVEPAGALGLDVG